VWPADQVERWPIDRLIPYAKNSRTHSEAQIAQLAASMKEWGWTNPVLADEAGGVIAGHARISRRTTASRATQGFLAARQLGYAEVPVMVARGWSDAQKRAYVIADNQLALTRAGIANSSA
jgi:ParB-like chromosome segregation protein Spo0J